VIQLYALQCLTRVVGDAVEKLSKGKLSKAACGLIVRLALVFSALSIGCAGHQHHLVLARTDFYAGQLESASARLGQASEASDRYADVLQLDQAMVQLWSGHPTRAEKLLIETRDRFDELETAGVTQNAIALATDDTRRVYHGEDYEKVLIRAMLALCNLMDDGEDVTAYAFQINEKQAEIIQSLSLDARRRDDVDSPKNAKEDSDSLAEAATDEKNADCETVDPREYYSQLALGPYLYGIVRESTLLNYDDAVRGYAQVVDWSPGFSQGRHDLERARHGVHSAPGHGVIYLFAMVGRGPHKEESVEIPTSQAMFVADRILSAIGEHSITPTVAPIKVPVVVQPRNPLDGLAVQRSDGTWMRTEPVSDLGKMAVQQSLARRSEIVGRAVARRSLKKAALYATKQVAETQGAAELALDLIGIAWEASESADTRGWEFLPETIQVLRLELPAGQQELKLQPVIGHHLIGTSERVLVEVVEGRNSFIMVNYPGLNRVGQVLQSMPH
jgi:hypothetical protein